jgi:hypothetical protein
MNFYGHHSRDSFEHRNLRYIGSLFTSFLALDRILREPLPTFEQQLSLKSFSSW